MLRKLTLIGFGILLSGIPARAIAQGQPKDPSPSPQLPPARKIPGITVADDRPLACVECHVNYVDMKLDARFSTLVTQWTEKVDTALLAKAQASAPRGMTLRGKHPVLTSGFDDIPGKCLTCHKRDSDEAPPFAQMLHAIHLTGGEANHFLTVYQGECTYCHKLDAKSGRWRIPSAPEK